MDEVGSEPARLSRRARTLVGAVLGLLVLGGAADRWQAEREVEALLDAVRSGEAVVVDSQRSLAGLFDYSGPLLTSADAPPGARAAAYDTLARDAARWTPRVDAERRDVAGLVVLPWHGDERAAREAYSLRLDRWVEVLQQTAEDPQGARPPTVGDSREAARTALVEVAGERADGLLGASREGRTRSGG